MKYLLKYCLDTYLFPVFIFLLTNYIVMYVILVSKHTCISTHSIFSLFRCRSVFINDITRIWDLITLVSLVVSNEINNGQQLDCTWSYSIHTCTHVDNNLIISAPNWATWAQMSPTLNLNKTAWWSCIGVLFKNLIVNKCWLVKQDARMAYS